MITMISESFKSIVSFSAYIAAALCVLAGVGAIVSTGLVAGLVVFGASALVLIVLYGTICLLIQNNELLKRIAEAQAPVVRAGGDAAADRGWSNG